MATSKSNSSSIKFAVLAIDAVCFCIKDNQLSVLLAKTSQDSPFPSNWAVIGGMIFPNETAEASVERHLEHKGGITGLYKEQLYTFSSINRDPRGRVVSVAYVALMNNKEVNEKRQGSVETKWYSISALPKLAYDHNEIVKIAYDRLRSRILYSNIAQYFLPEEFTLSELQTVYEIVLGKKLDKRNFRKKILASRIIKDTKHTRKDRVMRPAGLYTFISKRIQIAESF
jgi:8-oxo-dGTP diphosphatase